ncbi:MAG: hypothetical protein KA775_10220, partial [Ottowia sp.]|nr:hypothetical protein [Ottowia sp.]
MRTAMPCRGMYFLQERMRRSREIQQWSYKAGITCACFVMAALRLATLAAAVNPPTGQVYEAGSLVALGQGV